MRVGFVTALNFGRYGGFWTSLAADAGAEVVYADPEQAARRLGDPLVAAGSGAAFRAATAQALALQDVDVLVVPDLSSGAESRRGGGQDPFIAAFPEVLRSSGGLGNVFAVPAHLGEAVAPLAIEFLKRLTPDTGRVPRIWDRHRTALLPDPGAAPGQIRADTTGVIGQNWLLDDDLIRLANPAAERVLSQAKLPPALLLAEGRQVASGLLPSDTEVLGAARWFGRRGGIGAVTMLVDAGSGVDSWLAQQAAAACHRPLSVVALQDLLGQEALERHLLERSVADRR